MWLVLPNQLTLNISVCVFSLCLSFGLILRKHEDVVIYLQSTQFKNLTQNLIHVFLIFCVLALVNYLAYKNPMQWDITRKQTNRLNPQSVQVLKKVDQSLLFKVYSPRENAHSILPLLELYRLENSQIKIELIDPEINPLRVKEDEITRYGQVKIEFKDRSEKFSEYTEKAVTNALLKVLRNQKSVIYFSKGHRAASLRDEGSEGLSQLRNYLEAEGHKVDQVSLSSLKDITDRDNVLVIWGPRDGLLKEELSALKSFVQTKGNLMLAIDPQVNNTKKNNFDPFASLRNLIADERLLTIAHDLVVDSLSSIKDSGGAVPVISQFDSKHPITREMSGQVFFPLISSIQFLDPSAKSDTVNKLKGTFSRLAQTSEFPGSWAERDFGEVKSQKVSFDQGKDLMGPITVMAASELERGGKALVVGNSSFVHNRYFNFQNNFILFSNAVNWLLDQGDFISFSRPKGEAERLVLSAPMMDVIFYFSTILTPLLLLMIAFFLLS